MFLLYYFLFLDKTYNDQDQERSIIYQNQPLEVLLKKSCSKKFQNISQKNTCVGASS